MIRGWYNDVWLNHLRIKEVVLQNMNDNKNIIQAKFKENLWLNKKLKGKRKLRFKVSLYFIICYYYDTKRVENEKHFLIECVLSTPKLDLNFKMFVIITTFLTV